MKTTRFYIDADVLVAFKSQILYFVKYRTMAISHAARSELQPLDDVFTRLLLRLGISQVVALMLFHFAPLSARRDMDLLGIIHKTALRQRPPHFHRFFSRARAIHGRKSQLYFRRSIFGLIRFYNYLPEDVIQLTDITVFQKCLQNMMRKGVKQKFIYWHLIFRS